jgi:hypothetical protein
MVSPAWEIEALHVVNNKLDLLATSGRNAGAQITRGCDQPVIRLGGEDSAIPQAKSGLPGPQHYLWISIAGYYETKSQRI